MEGERNSHSQVRGLAHTKRNRPTASPKAIHRTAADRAGRDDVQRPAVDPHASERRMPMCESHSGPPGHRHMAGFYATQLLIGLGASAATLQQPGWPTLLAVLCLRNWNPLSEGCERRMLSEPQAHHPGLKEFSTWATDWGAAILSGQAMGGKMSWRADVGIWGGRVTPRDFPHQWEKHYYQPSRATGALLVVGVALSLPSNDPTPPRHLIIARPPTNQMSSCMVRPSITRTQKPVQKRQDCFSRSPKYQTSSMLRLWAWDGGNFASLWAEPVLPTPLAIPPSAFRPRMSNCLERGLMYSVSDHEHYAGRNH
ncbi:uncharacterized protein BO88DRAFT_424927 [Aspergillus vadensis CBS 113365]|uniref:Uncharacterized protein n=1 Tax=Aspergillus vadensis (strain CBS 113365 / IMI 142717 / IBT 24658) TaxID=1448311 RepID=A0A319C3G8_ASPVC|nr:hypothetical protein BO88DRAFT_424927 [Aspergillus vadensis CBS 113365]PYH69978.1 hypothetical protein BO88DRAFT_424927 [Aspergillus vadensis CBS 113365]